MLGAILQQPYVLAVAVAVLTATGMYYYTRSIEQDPVRCKKAFYKTLVVGLSAGLGLAYVAGRLSDGAGGGSTGAKLFGGQPELATEPFMPADLTVGTAPAAATAAA